MKIIHFMSHYPYPDQLSGSWDESAYYCRGGEWATFHLVEHLARRGNEIVMIASARDRLDAREQRSGYAVERFGTLFRIGETCFSPRMFLRPGREHRDADLVHVHNTTPPGELAGIWANRGWSKPLIVTHHGFERADASGGILRRAAVRVSADFVLDPIFHAATRIICNSPTFARQSRFLGRYAEKTVVIPNGVDLPDFQPAASREEARRRLGLDPKGVFGLYVGALVPTKGLGVLLDAIPAILKEHPDFRLAVLGRGPGEAQFRSQAGRLGISDRVDFRGFVGETATKALYYRACDVLVIPSMQSEMFPLVMLEGAASGCAIVSSNLETLRWFFLDGESARITPEGDVGGVSRAVSEILSSPRLAEELRVGARTRAAEFSWPEIARQTEELYAELIGLRGTPRDRIPHG